MRFDQQALSAVSGDEHGTDLQGGQPGAGTVVAEGGEPGSELGTEFAASGEGKGAREAPREVALVGIGRICGGADVLMAGKKT